MYPLLSNYILSIFYSFCSTDNVRHFHVSNGKVRLSLVLGVSHDSRVCSDRFMYPRFSLFSLLSRCTLFCLDVTVIVTCFSLLISPIFQIS